MWSFPRPDTLIQDLRYAARLLRRSPAFTVLTVTSLAVGIGASAVVFNVVDAVLFRPLAVRAPHELRHFQATVSVGRGHKLMATVPEPTFADMQRAADFADLIGFRVVEDVTFTAADRASGRMVRAELVSADYFEVLGVPARAGRVLGAADASAAAAAVVSERLWRTDFGGDPHVAGRTVIVNGAPLLIAGVAGNFRGLLADRPADLFLPLSAASLVEPSVEAPSIRLVARLRDGISPTLAEQKTAALYRATGPPMAREGELRVDLPDAALGVSDSRASLRQPLFISLTFVGVLLLVACANTGGLLVARLASRRGEFAVRAAIGAGRGRLIRQLVVEALLMASIAGAAALLLAWVAAPLLLRAIPIGSIAPDFDVRFDWRLVAFTAGASGVAALFAVAASLWRLIGSDPQQMIVAETRVVVARPRRVTSILIAAQVACSLLLVVGAGSLTRSLMNLRRVDPGFDTAGTFAVIADATGRASDPGALAAYFGRLHERMAVAAHVERVSLVQFPLLTSAVTSGTVDVSGFSASTDDDRWVRVFFIGPEFFETLGMRVLAGRSLGAQEIARGDRVAVVNQEFARFYFGDPGRALGRIVNRDIRIVGVAADGRYSTLRDEPVRAMFVPYGQGRIRQSMTFLVRPAGNGPLAMRAAVEAARAHDPQLKVKIVTLADQLTATLSRERFVAALAAALSALALFLSCAGLYGAVAYAASERHPELAIRLALGATRRDIVQLMLADPLKTAAIGAAAGVPAAYAAMRGLSSLLFGVSAFDPGTTGLSVALLLGIAGGAAWWPARRASTIDPVESLKRR